MRPFLLGFLVVLATGCWFAPRGPAGQAVVPAPGGILRGPPAVPANETPAEKRLREAQDTVDRLKGELAAAQGKVQDATQARDDERTAWLRRIALWAAGVLLLVTIVGTAVAVWLRSSALGGLALAAFAGFLVCLAAGWVLAHLALVLGVGALVVLCAVAVLVWHAHQRGVGLAGAIRVAETLKALPVEASVVDRSAAMRAAAGKASAVIDQFRSRLGLR